MLLRFSRKCGKTLQLLEFSRFQFHFYHDYTRDSFDFRFDFRFNFRFYSDLLVIFDLIFTYLVGTPPRSRAAAAGSVARPGRRRRGRRRSAAAAAAVGSVARPPRRRASLDSAAELARTTGVALRQPGKRPGEFRADRGVLGVGTFRRGRQSPSSTRGPRRGSWTAWSGSDRGK